MFNQQRIDKTLGKLNQVIFEMEQQGYTSDPKFCDLLDVRTELNEINNEMIEFDKTNVYGYSTEDIHGHVLNMKEIELTDYQCKEILEYIRHDMDCNLTFWENVEMAYNNWKEEQI